MGTTDPWAGLPVPQDDGAAAHLRGATLPLLALEATSGERVDIGAVPGWLVLYVYPRTGQPGVASPAGWDAIPGAKGCTPQACSFRDHYAELRALGATLYGAAAQDAGYLREARQRLQLPYHLLADPDLTLKAALGLPTFQAAGMELYRRLTLIARNGHLEQVFYPVFPPDRNVLDVIEWLRANP